MEDPRISIGVSLAHFSSNLGLFLEGFLDGQPVKKTKYHGVEKVSTHPCRFVLQEQLKLDDELQEVNDHENYKKSQQLSNQPRFPEDDSSEA